MISWIKIVGLALFIGLFVASASARVMYHNDTVRSNYGIGDIISGTLNVTLNHTNLDSRIRTNFANTSMSLRSFLGAHGFIVIEDYNCSTANCLPGYIRKESVTSFSVSNGQALVGFSLQGGDIRDVDDARVTFDSTAPASCYLDLSLDVLNYSNHYLTSGRYVMESCYEPRYGCFEPDRNDHDTVIMQPGTDYCEKILLPVAPAFLVGANITASTQGMAGITMKLHALDSTPLGECTLPNITQSSQVVECLIPYSSATQREYFVCVEPTGTGSNYQIRVETHNACGTNNFGATYPGDYEIFAKNLKFDTPRIDLSESSFYNATQVDLNDYLATYISEVYGGNCNPYCILPLRIFGTDQSVSISNSFIRYTSSLGQHTNSALYTIERGNVSVDSLPLVLDLARANMTIPTGARGNRLKIYIDNEEVINKPVSISSSFTFGITPSFAIFGQTTTFMITSVNVSSARWNFGDGSAPQTSAGKSISYRYLQQGTFNLEVEVTSTEGVVSQRTFQISVGDPHDAATIILNESQQRLNSIASSIKTYPEWIRDELNEQLGYSTLNQSVREAAILYGRATNDSDYAQIVNTLIGLDIPESVQSEVKATVPLVVGLENSDMGALRTLSGSDGDKGSDEDIRRAVGSWMLEHTTGDVEFNVISAHHETEIQPLLTVFKIQTRPRTSFDSETYLIINFNPNDLHFASPTDVQTVGSSSSLPLESANQVIEFSILDSVRPEELGAYITPPISQLGSFEEETFMCNFNAVCEDGNGETWKTCPNDCRPWGLAVIVIIIIILAGAVTLGLILWWYKRKYESSLFPNRQDLANLLTFITASSRSGMNSNDIRKKLKHAGWTGEQIAYALKKQTTLKNRTSGPPSDARFIKRPDFKTP